MGAYRYLFHPSYLITGKEDAANCFARGYLTVGTEMLELALNKVQSLAEECNRLQGFIIFRSFGGGTGSGFVSNMLKRFADDYGKSTKMEFAIYPSPRVRIGSRFKTELLIFFRPFPVISNDRRALQRDLVDSRFFRTYKLQFRDR